MSADRIYREAKYRLFGAACGEAGCTSGRVETERRAEHRDRLFTARACLLTAARDLGMETREPV